MTWWVIVILYIVHAGLLLRVGVEASQWEFWAITTCLAMVNLIAPIVDSKCRARGRTWRRWRP